MFKLIHGKKAACKVPVFMQNNEWPLTPQMKIEEFYPFFLLFYFFNKCISVLFGIVSVRIFLEVMLK